VNGWEKVASVVRVADRIINGVIAVVLIVALLYGGFGLWDNWMIYKGAGLDSDLLKYKPSASEDEDAPNPSLSELQKINPDVVAWLTVADTNIDYPVVQGQSNLEYINKAVDGSFSVSGSIFLDYQNKRDFSDFFSMVYGHHMEGNVMFGEVSEFLEQEYFEEHTTGMLFLPECTRPIQWFACLTVSAYDEHLMDPSSVEDLESRNELLNFIRKEAVQYRDIGVTASDQIIALYTCETASTAGRILLFGRMSAGIRADTEAKISARANMYVDIKSVRRVESLL
jgi:sortase B